MKQPKQTTAKGKTAKVPNVNTAKPVTARPEVLMDDAGTAEADDRFNNRIADIPPEDRPQLDGLKRPAGVKASTNEPRPMPKDFKLDTVREGSRVVARQDGIEVPFEHTDDKDEYAAREQTQREAMWAALEDRRIRGLAHG